MKTSSAGYVRPLGWLLGTAMILATILLLAVNLDLIAKPPEFPSSATLVDRLLGSQEFRHAIWPFDLASNLLLGLGFIAAIPLAWLISGGLDRSDGRRALLVGLIVSGAIVGIVATLAYIGAMQVSIDTAYCDCGFKEQESISQFWAVGLATGSRGWLLNGSAMLIAVGLAAGGGALSRASADGRPAAMVGSWGTLSYLAAAALAVGAVLQITGIADPAGPYVSAVATGILVPAWSFWLALRFGTPETRG